MSSKKPSTLGQLRATDYRSRSVKQEIRSNLRQALVEGRILFPGVLGFDRTVIPGVVT